MERAKKVWTDACEETIGKKKATHKDWTSLDTMEKIEVRKKAKADLNNCRTIASKIRVQEQYGNAHKEVRRSVRGDKGVYIDSLARAAEEAAEKRKIKDLYSYTRRMAGKHQRVEKPVKNKSGKPLNTAEEQLKRWAEHFGGLLIKIDLPP